jgi:hypothetical protein
MADFKKIKALSWVAPVAMVGALGLAACGDDDSDAAVQTRGAPAVVANGSDRHLENLADQLSLQADVAGSDVHLANQAAEIAEQQAKLDNSAKTHTTTDEAEPSSDEFVPGTRRMPVR